MCKSTHIFHELIVIQKVKLKIMESLKAKHGMCFEI